MITAKYFTNKKIIPWRTFTKHFTGQMRTVLACTLCHKDPNNQQHKDMGEGIGFQIKGSLITNWHQQRNRQSLHMQPCQHKWNAIITWNGPWCKRITCNLQKCFVKVLYFVHHLKETSWCLNIFLHKKNSD